MADDDNPFAASDRSTTTGDGPPWEGIDGLDDLAPADLFARFIANLIDSVIIALAVAGPIVAIALLSTEAALAMDSTPDSVFGVLGIAAGTMYGGLEGTGMHGTIGKRMMGLMSVDHQGQPLTIEKALLRNVTKSAMLNLCGILALTVLMKDRHAGLWNQMSGTYVVQRPYIG